MNPETQPIIAASDMSGSLSDDRYRFLLQQMPGFVGVLTGPEHVLEYVNDAYIAIAGPRQFIGRTMREVFPDIEGQGYFEILDEVYLTGVPFTAKSMPIRLVGETEDRFIDLLYQPIRDDRQTITGIFVGGYDITERVRGQANQDALVRLTDALVDLIDPNDIAFEASRHLGEALRVSRVGYGTIDSVAETLHVERDWNAPGVETLAGSLPLRAYGTFIDNLKRGEFISIGDVDTDDRTVTAAVALKNKSAASFINYPFVEKGQLVAVFFINHGAARQWTKTELTLVKEFGARTRSAVERSRNELALRELNATLQERVDTALREQAAAEDGLRQAQKMEAVGQLTGGLAHDFNNLLTGIMGNLELLQGRISRGRLDDLDRFIAAAQGAGRRAASLTQRLLAFSRRQTLDPKPTDVNRLIAGMEDLLRRTVGSTTDIEIVGAGGLWTANIDAGQLENALLNLCINARDAMAEGGRITVETANKWLDARAAKERDLPPGQYVSVSVSDTGTGMSADTISHVFEPFFTTKPIGQGTGLGLSMVYGFARQSGGQVRIYSELGQGTTVCVYLPRQLGEADAIEAGDAARGMHIGPTGQTVLVVDDEPTIRHLIEEVLNDAGYTVIDVADGAAGIKILQSGVRVDLLITDVGLPNGMNGRQVADAARTIQPGLKVMFITGYAENAAIGNGHLEAGMELLTKPFTMDALAAKVADMMDQKPMLPDVEVDED